MRLRKNGPARIGLIDQLLNRKPSPHRTLICHTLRTPSAVDNRVVNRHWIKRAIIAQMLCFRDNFQLLRVEITSTARNGAAHRNNHA
jgi:hypothetical protein